MLALECLFDFLLLHGIAEDGEDNMQSHQLYRDLMFTLEHEQPELRLAAVKGFSKLCYVRGLENEGIMLCLISALFHESTEKDYEYVVSTFH